MSAVSLPRRWHACLVLLVATLALALLPASAAGAPEDDLSPAGAQPQLVNRVAGHKAPSSRLAETPAGLRRITSPKPVPVLIKYDFDAVASYTGTIAGLAATSPAATGRPVRVGGAAERDYLGFLREREQTISADVVAAAPGTEVTRRFEIVYGGVAATVPGNRIREILRVPGVVAVQPDSRNRLLTDSSTDFINAPAAYEALGGEATAGAGMLLGNLDSGVWPEHPSFDDPGTLPPYDGPELACGYGDNPLTPADDPFVCNDKLVGGAAFVDTYNSYVDDDYRYADSARDSDGHGSHTATTSAGSIVEDVETLGPVLERINGVAPGAQIMEYRVCGPRGCFSSDSTAAVGQAILDGVDVINFSITGGTEPLADPVELAFLDAYHAGVFVAASAGNEGPGAGTANHLSPWTTTVAASTQTRTFAASLTLTAAGGATFETIGASITAGVGPLPVVSAAAAPYSSPLCLAAAPASLFTGKVVVCARGGNADVDKGFNLRQGGAAGMILVNPALADVTTDNHWLPTVHVADGTDLLAFLAAHAQVTGQLSAGTARDGQGDVIAARSSRGPGGTFLKPDITAPGVQILAAHTPTPQTITGGPPSNYYRAISGTSMSSPHVAGVALLLRALHPEWGPGQIKSAMMTQATTGVVKEDLVTPADPFDTGAGRVDVAAAMAAPLTISETAENFLALTGDPVRAVDLNLPSVNAPTMPGRLSTARTLTNVTDRTLAVRAFGSVSSGSVRFDDATFRIRPGESHTVEIVIRSRAATDVQQFGSVGFATNRGTARIPVAFVRRQGTVSLTQSCADASVPKRGTTTCAITATTDDRAPQEVSLRTNVTERLRLVAADGAEIRDGVARATGTVQGASLGVPSVGPGDSVAGYLPLAAFGITPAAIGDEDVLNFNVPAYSYNGVSYTQVGVTSNGYLVAGGGSSEDVSCCVLPDGPSSALPNDVLAPFWTDLDGTGAPGVSVGTLTDGVSTWLVVQWEVRVWGTTDQRAFQVRVGVNGVQDISYSYAAAQSDPNGQDYLVGAENQAGEGDMTVLLPTEGLRVTSTDPPPGRSLGYRVTVQGRVPGWADVHTEMRASRVPGVTTVDTELPVVRRR